MVTLTSITVMVRLDNLSFFPIGDIFITHWSLSLQSSLNLSNERESNIFQMIHGFVQQVTQ